MLKRKYTYTHTTNACYRGLMTQAIINNLAPLLFIIFQTSYSISYEKLGQLILVNFSMQILADLWATRYADHYGYRKCMVVAHALCVVGLLSLGILPLVMSSPYIGLVIAIIIYALGGGLLEVVVSPIVEALPNDNKGASMSLLHSFYCWGQMLVVILSTTILWVIGRDHWYILPILWSLFPLYNLFQFLYVPIQPLIIEGKGMRLKELLSKPSFYLAMLLMICAGASELTMSQWSSMFAEKGLLIPKLYGDLLGPALFAFFMAIGRTLYGHFGERLPMKACLFGSSILCLTTYLLTIFSPNPLASILACSFCGFSVALLWPGTFSLSSAAFPKGGTLMFGILAVCGDIGCSFGPWLAGTVSDIVQVTGHTLFFWTNSTTLDIEQIGLRSGLLSATIFPLLIGISLLIFRRKRQQENP